MPRFAFCERFSLSDTCKNAFKRYFSGLSSHSMEAEAIWRSGCAHQIHINFRDGLISKGRLPGGGHRDRAGAVDEAIHFCNRANLLFSSVSFASLDVAAESSQRRRTATFQNPVRFEL
jgi:hypothetical protein